MRYLKGYFLALTVITLASCTSNDDTTKLGNWVRKAEYNGNARRKAACFVIGDTAYVGAGQGIGSDNTEHGLNDFWKYDPVKDTWTSIAAMGPAGVDVNGVVNIYSRFGASSFAVGSRGYVTTGYSNTNGNTFAPLKDTWEYNPASNSWAPKADFPGNARLNAVGFGLGNFGYVGTGTASEGSGTNFADFYKFAPGADGSTGTWTQADGLKDKRTDAVSFVIKDSAYVVTGSSASSVTRMYVYDANNDQWLERWQITNATDGSFDDDYTTIVRSNAVAFVIDNKAYLATGTASNTWEYDPITGHWTEKTPFDGLSRSGAVGFAVKNRGFVGLGYSGSTFLDDLREFQPTVENSTNDN
jgi:N-acetylneuraminic acid mutarotase